MRLSSDEQLQHLFRPLLGQLLYQAKAHSPAAASRETGPTPSPALKPTFVPRVTQSYRPSSDKDKCLLKI